MSIEKRLEKRLKQEVFKKGGHSFKWVSPGHNGVPDQIIFMPGGRVYVREIKDEGVEPKPLQKHVIKQLQFLGVDAGWINSDESLDQFLKHIDR